MITVLKLICARKALVMRMRLAMSWDPRGSDDEIKYIRPNDQKFHLSLICLIETTWLTSKMAVVITKFLAITDYLTE